MKMDEVSQTLNIDRGDIRPLAMLRGMAAFREQAVRSSGKRDQSGTTSDIRGVLSQKTRK